VGKELKGSPEYWSTKDSLEFYSVSRRKIEDLYDSEKVFLPRILKKGMKVLDVGCAAGGFYNIMKEIEPDIVYYGCDFAEALIRKAKKNYNQGNFIIADSVNLPFIDDYFDLVNCAGTCHMISDYFNAIKQMYGVSRQFCIFDVRLTNEAIDFDMGSCYQKLCFKNNSWDGISLSPYIVLNGKNFLRQLLNNLSPKPKSVYATGYLKAPASTVTVPLNKLCMTVFMIEKPTDEFKGRTEICLDMPDDYMDEKEFKNELWAYPSQLYERLKQK
jgi:SAM-dependent methyltransferase